MSKKSDAGGRSQRAADVLKEQRAAERKRNLITGGLIAAVLGGLVVLGITIVQSNEVEAPTAGASEYGVAIGDPDAPHSLVVYEDFLCPACGAFEAESHEQLEDLAAEGKVHVEYRPFALLSQFGDYSARAAGAFGVVLDESGPEVAKEFHDRLFADQPPEGEKPYPDADWLVEQAVEAGAEEDAVRAGIEEGVNDFAREATAEAEKAGVSATPTVLLDGEVFNGSVDELLAELE
jgi:protein-disulfide isomerase